MMSKKTDHGPPADNLSYSIAGRSLSKYSFDELKTMRRHYRAELTKFGRDSGGYDWRGNAERALENIAAVLLKKRCAECIHFKFTGPESEGIHHHKECPKYFTEKFSHLFYYEDAVNGWIPTPDLVENIIDVESHFFESNETVSIIFKRIDLTDNEFDLLPED